MSNFFDQRAYVYTTNHHINQLMSKHLTVGFHASMAPAIYRFPGLSICYGILRGTGDIIKDAITNGADYLYCDHSFFGKYRPKMVNGEQRIDHETTYYRLSKNSRTCHEIMEFDNERLGKLNIELKPWRKSGEHIVVAPMSKYVAQYLSDETGIVDADLWLSRQIHALSTLTDRQIIIRPKDASEPLSKILENAWALVCYDSNSAVDAAIMGIPVFCAKTAAAAPVGNIFLNDIESPGMPDREKWLAWLANQQFTIKEIENGTAKAVLGEKEINFNK